MCWVYYKTCCNFIEHFKRYSSFSKLNETEIGIVDRSTVLLYITSGLGIGTSCSHAPACIVTTNSSKQVSIPSITLLFKGNHSQKGQNYLTAQKCNFSKAVLWRVPAPILICLCQVMWARYQPMREECPDNKVDGANMGPIWGRQDQGGPHVRPMKFVI